MTSFGLNQMDRRVVAVILLTRVLSHLCVPAISGAFPALTLSFIVACKAFLKVIFIVTSASGIRA